MDIVHLTLFLLLSISFNLVSADETLIKVQCHNAAVPTTCIQCVESDPQSQSADKVGIVSIVITCLRNKAETLSTNMSALASSAHDKDVQAIFEACKELFAGAKTNLIKARDELKNKDYDQTNSDINIANHQEFSCRKQVKDLVKLPDNIKYDIRVFEELSDAAMRMIDRF